MALALVLGRKSQFRRQLIPQPPSGDLGNRLPRYEPGDLVWVQERFVVGNGGPVASVTSPADCLFHADFDMRGDTKLAWHPATDLPRAGSRLTLRLDEVCVTRLHTLTDEEAVREGVTAERTSLARPPIYTVPGTDIRAESPRAAYAALWDHLHSGAAWDADPLIYRCSFTIYHANVDVLTRSG